MPVRTGLATPARPASSLRALLLLQLTFAAPAMPAAADPSEVAATLAEIRPPGATRAADPARQLELSRSVGWRSFVARHGQWSVQWNEATRSPHRAIGTGILLGGFADDSASVDRAVRRFIEDEAGVLGSPVLETVAAQRRSAVWYVRYRQRFQGVPLLNTDWEFRVGTNGRLFAFGADAHFPSPAVLAAPKIAASVARVAAVRGIPFDVASDRVAGGDRVFLLPMWRGDRVEYRAVYDLRIHTESPTGRWAVLVDAASGEVLQRQSLIRHMVSGHASGPVHIERPFGPLTITALPHLFVTVDAETVATDETGHYSSDASSGTITAGLRGRYCDVNRADGSEAAFSTTASGSGVYDILWDASNSQDAERDVYHSVNVAHAYIKQLDPDLVRLDRPVPCLVNNATTACNGFWDGHGMVFGPADMGCPNTASDPTVVYHEYGHGITNELFRQAANDTNAYMQNYVISEASAELNAMFVADSPVQGRDSYGPGTFVRLNGVEARWPEDQSVLPYQTMFILTGAFWDLRLAAGKELAERLTHFAQWGMPDDVDDGIAMSEYFVEAVVADDDDADLSNGTPHLAAILQAFNPRGIGTSFFLHIGHVPIADQPEIGAPVPVTATFAYGGPFGALDPASPTLVYSIDGGPMIELPMAASGNPDEYRAEVPATGGGLVRYYLQAADVFGGITTHPVGAPSRRPHAFVCGPRLDAFRDEMETERGWTIGAPGDNATGGVWVRLDPTGSLFIGVVPAQTENDHTPGAGTQCWVTGNTSAGRNYNFADVDSGRTSLTSPRLDASALVDPMIEYYRWYFDQGAVQPGTDPWRAYLSNDDGVSWTPIENSSHNENRWERMLIRIADHMIPTATMRVRFVAEDILVNTSVEAAVDDFALFGLDALPTAVFRLEATALAEGVELRWGPVDPSRYVVVGLERSETVGGPWQVIDAALRHDGETTVAVDRSVEQGRTYFYRLTASETTGGSIVLGSIQVTSSGHVTALALDRLRPNPSSGPTRIEFSLSRAGFVRLSVLDVAGREVACAASRPYPSGRHEVAWEGAGPNGALAPGVYFVRLDAEGSYRTRRLVIAP